MIVVIRTAASRLMSRGRKLPQSEPSGNFTRAAQTVGAAWPWFQHLFRKTAGSTKKFGQRNRIKFSGDFNALPEHVFQKKFSQLMEQLTRGVHTLQPPHPLEIKNTSDKGHVDQSLNSKLNLTLIPPHSTVSPLRPGTKQTRVPWRYGEKKNWSKNRYDPIHTINEKGDPRGPLLYKNETKKFAYAFNSPSRLWPTVAQPNVTMCEGPD